MITLDWTIRENEKGEVLVRVKGGSTEGSTERERAFVFALQGKVEELLTGDDKGTFITRFPR